MAPSELLDQAVALAKEAGVAIMAVYGRTEITSEIKANQSPLTEADLSAHRIISEGLRRLTPDISVLSEEDCQAFSGENEAGLYWLVDPLDGTKEFLSRNGEFTVNLALIEQGTPILGVVLAPALGICYLAAKGAGAHKLNAAGQRCALATSGRNGQTPWRVVGSRSHAGDSLRDFLTALGRHEFVPMGSSLKLCLVAEGRADLYPRFGPTHHWDTAAAHCVVEQAGGQVMDLSGKPLRYPVSTSTLNPHFLVLGGGLQFSDLPFLT